jgi:hypothetical protein
MIKRKRTNNAITQQTKEQATGALHNTKVELWFPAMVNSFSSICDTGRVTIATNNKIMNQTIVQPLCYVGPLLLALSFVV